MIYVLRLVHILSGAFWFGATVFTVKFMMPSLGVLGPGAGPVMTELMKRKLPAAMMGSGILTVVSGVWLMYVVSGGEIGAWMHLNSSRTFATGGTFAILALIVGMIMNPPAAKRLGAIAAAASQRGGPPSSEELAEMKRLQQRIHTGSMIVTALLTLTVAAMAVARYM